MQHDKLNKKEPSDAISKRTIASMDAKALFTSLEADRSSEIVKYEVIISNIKFEDA